MNWKVCEKKWLWPSLRCCPSFCLEELRKTIKKTSVRIVDFPAEVGAPHKYKPEVLPLEPTCSVTE
jgi:hypothetical protein